MKFKEIVKILSSKKTRVERMIDLVKALKAKGYETGARIYKPKSAEDAVILAWELWNDIIGDWDMITSDYEKIKASF